jgi:hypothetical protein
VAADIRTEREIQGVTLHPNRERYSTLSKGDTRLCQEEIQDFVKKEIQGGASHRMRDIQPIVKRSYRVAPHMRRVKYRFCQEVALPKEEKKGFVKRRWTS